MKKTAVDPHDIYRAVMCSVVPLLMHAMEDMVVKLTGKELITLTPEVYKKLPLDVVSPYEIGADIVASALGARSLYDGDLIVVDFGTALTVCGITSHGKLTGISIAPGMKTAVQSLTKSTAQLPDVPLKRPPSVMGKNTVHAIQSGVVLGYAGMVEYLVKEYAREMNSEPKVIATGGLSYVMEGLTDLFFDTERDAYHGRVTDNRRKVYLIKQPVFAITSQTPQL
ncbi:MAG: type III pantothenate kinase [Bacteroidales bacterium]|nr:type III pantothenate kinase [Bacteroidales bacterium]